ncbi:hypothetical protein CW736_06060 [Nonlabens sp. MB-3u-79]|uniref:hypothetical protein n=1 Tax=Nonlabens sp. MB-3u-79 TaxID=2058134 RepID=UPI000C30F584|nr:hypothetical protein [Nonlabens sp. MB-3u-79]AUC78990.1 hypothetical protein CW736_06060 [Nonlabens sp. MB-3u-79]
MMRYVLISVFIIFSVVPIAGQEIVDIQADYVELDPDQLRYYTRIDDNSFQVSYYGFDGYQELTIVKKNWIKDSKQVDSLVHVGTLISVDEIRSLSLSSLQKEWKEKSFYYRPYKDLEILKNLDNGLFGYGEIKNDLYIYDYYRIVPIRINKSKILYQFVGLKNETLYKYLIPFNKRYCLSGDFESTEVHDKELVAKWNVQWREESDPSYMYDIEDNYIYDYTKKEKLIERKHDSIDGDYYNHIIGFKDKEIFVYDVFLNDITPQNLRSISRLNEKCLQVLIGNEVKYLSNSGETFRLPIATEFFICGMRYFDTEIEKNEELYSLTYITDLIPEDPFEDYKTIYLKVEIDSKLITEEFGFLNERRYQLTNFNYYYGSGYTNNFLISNNKKDKFIFTPFIFESELTDDLEEVNHELTIQYDQQVEYDSFIYNKDDQTTIVVKNNLKGYLGINKKPKYKTLEEFQGSFARFELPDGRKGWLQKNAKEFLDQ